MNDANANAIGNTAARAADLANANASAPAFASALANVSGPDCGHVTARAFAIVN